LVYYGRVLNSTVFIKFYWTIAMLFHIHIIDSCFCVRMAHLSSHGTAWSAKPKLVNIYYLVPFRRNLLTAGLDEKDVFKIIQIPSIPQPYFFYCCWILDMVLPPQRTKQERSNLQGTQSVLYLGRSTITGFSSCSNLVWSQEYFSTDCL
jgi:hypothetical protein